MNYEWDEQKRSLNFAKHGIDFSDAIDFNWSLSLIEPDSRYEYNEPRFNALAPIENRVYVMTFTRRGDNIRIISFRKANKREVTLMSATLKFLMPTDEEETQINAGILSDPDSFEFTQQQLEDLQPTVKVLPEIVEAYQRGDFKRMRQKTVAVRLSDEVVAYFKKSSSNWQSSIDAVLKEYIAQH